MNYREEMLRDLLIWRTRREELKHTIDVSAVVVTSRRDLVYPDWIPHFPQYAVNLPFDAPGGVLLHRVVLSNYVHATIDVTTLMLTEGFWV